VISELFETAVTGDQFLTAMQDTLIMVALSLGFGSLLGLPLGIVLVICRPGGIQPNRLVHQLLNPIVNIIRSLPFIILLITILPLTRLLVNTTIGTAGAIVPLVIFIAPYISRLVENALLEVDEGILESANAMGATTLQTIWYFMIPEAASSLVLALTTATIGLLGATAMAGTVGGGGIGDLAITYGYQRFDAFATISTALVLIVIVQLLQTLGTRLSRRIRRE
jgi:D-methionine transport system permease protein